MTKEQIQDYTYCQTYQKNFEEWKKRIPFGSQHFGCGSRDPRITFKLEAIHREMYNSVLKSINTAEDEVKRLISEI